ncbi:hypothetical protein COCCADRAFT_4595 [Bipolaris zeicola 26-R-13]|uniref:Serine-rich protein n=1 Tax=Cochliobolus carbonum (strain 26-R-13) TaxID=930089 RepID=W6YR63_COCC2|nr:uncharacterized protein COCCADRAFT_4595 [Bipolaris zeicola 26-R-13]EUC33966.1 hypothetical protein COCCADRAFT_4595 [Bipolaris zeicola 26-R-13]
MSSSNQRAKTPTALTLPQGPRFSPPKSPSKDSSPVRRPLHERSNSQANQHSSPTIRLVHDTPDDIYQKYPVPSEPSQILSPPRHAPGYGFERPERPGSRVSSNSQVASVVAKFEASRVQTPQPIVSRKKGVRHSAATSTSEEDTFVSSAFTPSSVRFSQDSTAPSSPPPEFDDGDTLDVLQEEPRSQRPTIRAVPPSSSGGDSFESRNRALTPKASAASFASTILAAHPSSSGHGGNTSRLSIGPPLPQGDESTPSSDFQAGRSALTSDTDNRQHVLKPQQSTDSITFSDISSTSIEPTTSPISHEASTVSFASGVRINYPIVRVPSSSTLRAESQNQASLVSRMQDRSSLHQWSSQLSTIPSASERDSRSIARGSRSFGARSHSQESYSASGRTNIPRRRGQTVSSAQSSLDNASSEAHSEYSAVPQPLFSPASKSSLDDNNSEHLDTISPLPSSVPLRVKNSGYLRKANSVESMSMDETSRPVSAQSSVSIFLANNIPAWARAYYQKGERISGGAPESEYAESVVQEMSQSGRSHTPSESNYPPNIYRPRNRPRHRAASFADTVSLADDAQSIDGAAHGAGARMYQIRQYSTPHLRTDRRGDTRYSAWNAPSLDADVHVTLLGRQNRQILLFCLGFICPLSWIVASFLPLPLNPNHMAGASTSSQADLEQQFAQSVGPVDDKAFQKATWWRNLNRVMSGVGTLLIGVIIALAILASRMT